MKGIKILLSVTVILSALLGLLNAAPFETTHPIMCTALATLLMLRAAEYRKCNDRSGFIWTILTALFVYAVTVYIVFIG